MIAHSCWFGSGFIYARLNLNQYIGLGKKEGGAGVMGESELCLNLNAVSFLTSSYS